MQLLHLPSQPQNVDRATNRSKRYSSSESGGPKCSQLIASQLLKAQYDPFSLLAITTAPDYASTPTGPRRSTRPKVSNVRVSGKEWNWPM